MHIHIRRDGQTFGPFTIAQVQEFLKTGKIKPTDLAWKEGNVDFKPLNTLSDYDKIVAPPSPVSSAPAQPLPSDTPTSVYSKFKPWHVIASLAGLLLVVFIATSAIKVSPLPEVLSGERLPGYQVNKLKQAQVINDSERVVYFDSDGPIKNNGKLITTERLIFYQRGDGSEELEIHTAAYQQIQNIKVTKPASPKDDTALYIALKDKEGFYLLVPTTENRDERFITKLTTLWDQNK